MKLTFCCDSGANAFSCREAEIDTHRDLGLEDGEWETMTDDEKQALVEEWAHDRLEIFWREEE